MSSQTASSLLREARTRAGLTQRALAARAGTSQSVVARIESGTTSPTWQTLAALLESAGFTVHASVELRGPDLSHMLGDVPRILALTPEARLLELGNVSRFLACARRRA